MRRKISAVYAIRNVRSNRIYVGSSIDVAKRWSSHKLRLNKGIHHSGRFQASWRKHGSEAFVFEILEHVPAQQLIAREQFWIVECSACCRRRGLNMSPTAGSQLGAKHSAASRARMSRAAKGKKKTPWSVERRAAYVPHNKGKKASPETCAKISAATRGKKYGPISEEKRQLLSIAAKKRGMSEELIAKAHAATRGRKQSSDERQKRSATMKARCSNNPAFSAFMREVALAQWAERKQS